MILDYVVVSCGSIFKLLECDSSDQMINVENFSFGVYD